MVFRKVYLVKKPVWNKCLVGEERCNVITLSEMGTRSGEKV
jgi:hypothetical protein